MSQLEPTTWGVFRESGMLWWTNRILHTLGWSIIVEISEDGKGMNAYPARTTWLGFSPETNDKRWAQFREYLKGRTID